MSQQSFTDKHVLLASNATVHVPLNNAQPVGVAIPMLYILEFNSINVSVHLFFPNSPIRFFKFSLNVRNSVCTG